MKQKANSANCLKVTVVTCVVFCRVHGQQIVPSLVWERLYEHSACDIYTVVETADNGYVLGGRIYSAARSAGRDDCILMKIDSGGEIEWDKVYGGTDNELMRSVRQTKDGGYVFAANSSSPPSGNKESQHLGREDVWIVKSDALGNKEWENSFGGADEDAVYLIREDAESGYIFEGRSGLDYWAIKIDIGGEKEWQRSLSETNSGLAHRIVSTADGGYALAGNSGFPSGPYGGTDGWILKVDGEGRKLWERFFGGTESEIFLSVDQAADGGFILGGRSSSPPSGNKEAPYFGVYDYWLVKLDAAGNKEWDRSYGSAIPTVEEIRVVRQAIDGGYVVGGQYGGRSKFVKVDARGDLECEHYLGAAGGSHAVELDELQRTRDRGYILTGSFDYPNAEPPPFSCAWGAWAAKFETILSRAGEVVTWEADAGVVLESVDDLNGEWEADQSVIRTIGGANTIAFTPAGESRYYRLRGSSDLLSFGTLLSWPASINHILEFSSNNGGTWTPFAGDQGTIGTTNYAIIPPSMKEHDFRTRKAN